MKRILFAIALFVAAVLDAKAQNLAAGLQEKVAAVKQSMAQNQAALKAYQWTSHTEILLKGEVKKTKDELCRYGPDGTVQKTELDPNSPEGRRRGLRGRIVEKKKEELADYMNRAESLIHDYVLPNSQTVEQAFQQGNLTLGEAAPGTIQIQIKNYWKTGDSLTLTFNSAAKALTALMVNTYLDEKDPITLQVNFQTLPDGTNYPATTLLNAPEKKVTVQVQNANYERVGN